MRFGVFWPYSRTLLPSAEIAARNPDVLDIANHIALAQAAEATGFDFALIADGYSPASEANSRIGFQDPSTNAVTWAPYLFAATRTLGIMSTVHTGFLHPVVIARLGAHLDFLSGGRWGWNIVNGFRPHEAKLFGIENLDHDGGYDLSDEAVGIIKTLWTDPKEGFVHHGKHFRIDGKLRRPLPPTQPILVSAASSARGRAFAARHCEYLFASPVTAADVLEMAQDLNRAATDAGRDKPPQILMLADIFIRDEPGRAAEEYAALLDTRDGEALSAWSSHLANTQFRGKRPEDVPAFLGRAEEVAEQIITLHRESGLTGILCRFPLWHADEALRVGKVFAILARAGIWIPPQGRAFGW
jgi:alkanesulfonate monooxygenase SsuD/methylene tetrahydromethanopterin reductase-like flavin-dependent oxidoreductase (luciferase family)